MQARPPTLGPQGTIEMEPALPVGQHGSTYRTAPPAGPSHQPYGAAGPSHQPPVSQQHAHGGGYRVSLFTDADSRDGHAQPVAQTPLYLVNDGVRMNKNNRPDIFRSSKEPQVLSLPSRSGRNPEVATPKMPSGATDVERNDRIGVVRNDRIFGAANLPVWKESMSQELGGFRKIETVSQLQRALQSKIMQGSRPLVGVHALFQKLDRRRRGHIDFVDLKAAVRDFNLDVPDELVGQLLRAIDSDHDGVLSLAEFVAGLKANNQEGVRLNTPQVGISSRAYFRTIPFNHPFHNVMNQAPQHFFTPGQPDA